MKKKIIIILIVLAVVFFIFYVFQGSRFQKTSVIENITKNQNENSSDYESAEQNSADSNEISSAPDIEVKPADCDNECRKFDKKENELEYCQQICGISEIYEQDYENSEGKVETDDCQKQRGIKKDYCLKDLAISEDDLKICSQITDNNIKKTCNNRFIEELLEEQNSQPSEDF